MHALTLGTTYSIILGTAEKRLSYIGMEQSTHGVSGALTLKALQRSFEKGSAHALASCDVAQHALAVLACAHTHICSLLTPHTCRLTVPTVFSARRTQRTNSNQSAAPSPGPWCLRSVELGLVPVVCTLCLSVSSWWCVSCCLCSSGAPRDCRRTKTE